MDSGRPLCSGLSSFLLVMFDPCCVAAEAAGTATKPVAASFERMCCCTCSIHSWCRLFLLPHGTGVCPQCLPLIQMHSCARLTTSSSDNPSACQALSARSPMARELEAIRPPLGLFSSRRRRVRVSPNFVGAMPRVGVLVMRRPHAPSRPIGCACPSMGLSLGSSTRTVWLFFLRPVLVLPSTWHPCFPFSGKGCISVTS